MTPRSSNTRSIGEVLAVLKTEFADVTISKIRFLEAQGLVEPARTASGYRKFDDGDIARLRFVLREQREHFLPLKVIKDKLTKVFPSPSGHDDSSQPNGSHANAGGQHEGGSSPLSGELPGPVDRAGLLRRSGLTEGQLRELEGFGLVVGRRSADGTWYDPDSANVAVLAARFLRHGVEVRHLRIFRTAADREADLYRQLTTPARALRNSQARMDAIARLEELVGLGAQMRAQLLHQFLAND